MLLRAYFYLNDYREKIEDETISPQSCFDEYHTQAAQFFCAVGYLNYNLRGQMSEEEINAVVFDAARVFDAQRLPLFFKRLYLVLTGSESGAKLSTLIVIMGVDNFLHTLNGKIKEINNS